MARRTTLPEVEEANEAGEAEEAEEAGAPADTRDCTAEIPMAAACRRKTPTASPSWRA